MGKIGIIYNDGKPEAAQYAQALREWLHQRGRQVCVATGVGGLLGYAQAGSPVCHTPVEWLVPPGFDRDVELTIVLGGDGTVLSASRQCAPLGIPLLTVNTGHLGFLTEIYVESLPTALEAVLSGDYQVEERITLLVQVWEEDARIWEALALNEVVLHREPLAKLCHFEVQVGHHAAVDIPADGVIVSTPTGSTAYALSAGGPVLAPGVAALLLIPICPHSLASRALVFDDREKVQVWAANASRLVLVADGNAGCYVQPGHYVTIQRSPYLARFVRLRPPEFFDLLRQKLGWGLPHQAKPKN
ncbi:MAG: NAD(+) kinase [Gloeomargarita sp. GMQP_bins_120]